MPDRDAALREALASALPPDQAKALADRLSAVLADTPTRAEVERLLSGAVDAIARGISASLSEGGPLASLREDIADVVREEVNRQMPVLVMPSYDLSEAGPAELPPAVVEEPSSSALEAAIRAEVARIAGPGGGLLSGLSPEALYDAIGQRLQPQIAGVIQEALCTAAGAPALVPSPDLNLDDETIHALARQVSAVKSSFSSSRRHRRR